MERVFTELTPECEITARMYAQGYEKKEIANFKCRAVSTWKIQCKLPPKTKRFCPLVLK